MTRPRLNILEGHKYDGKSSLTKFLNSSPLIWKKLGKEFFKYTDKLSQRSSRESLLISDEFGFWENTNDPCVAARHIEEMRRTALENHFSKVKVLICIRKQDTWLASAYAETSKNFQKPSQSHFERWVESRIDPYSKFYSSTGVRLRYHSMFSELSKYMKLKNLKIIPFELLSQNYSKYISEINNFIDNSEVQESHEKEIINKKSKSQNTWKVSPKYIRLKPSRLFSMLGLKKVRLPSILGNQQITLKKEMSKNIMKLYETENKLMDKEIRMNLKSYNYY